MTLGRSFSRSLVAAATLNLAIVAQAIAAPSLALPFDIGSVGARDLLLYGSIALLVVALIAKVIRDRHEAEAVPEGTDLRWWKNPPPNPQP